MARRASTKPKPTSTSEALPTREQEPRRFLLELLAVTLGVLLALILEQVVNSWRAGQRVDDIKAAMNKEISDYAEIFNLRVRIDPCIGSKLDALEAHVAGGRPGPVKGVGRPSYFFSGRNAFSSDATDQLTRHLGADTVQKYGEVYQGMADFAAFSAEEQKIWVILQTLEGDKDPVGPDRRAHLREALVGARNSRLLLNAIATQMLDRSKELGVERNRSLDKVKIAETPLCRPLAPASPA
jgi:hypothetical protein